MVYMLHNFHIMKVVEDFRKIINQVLGKENMFGYKTTLANQFYLITCFLGNLYYTDKIAKSTKYLLTFSIHLCTMVTFSAIITYLIYGRNNEDIQSIIYLAFAITIVFIEMFLIPAIAMFCCKSDIEEMIRISDKIILKAQPNRNESEDFFDVKKITINLIVGLWIPSVPYFLLNMLEVIVFYDEEMFKDYSYYLVPLFGLDLYGSMEFFVCYNIIQTYSASFFLLMYTMYPLLSVLCTVVCYNEARRIVNKLNALDNDFNVGIDSNEDAKLRFKRVIKESIHALNDLIRYIIHITCNIRNSHIILFTLI